MYLWWFDDRAKVATPNKIIDAIAAYQERNGTAPNVVCVWLDADIGETIGGCQVRREAYIRPNNVWVGREVQP